MDSLAGDQLAELAKDSSQIDRIAIARGKVFTH